jgi:pilus assembly protein Flp/PilA
MNLFFSPSKQTEGQGLVEYAIILALVAIVVIAVVTVLGPTIGNTFTSINNSLDSGGLLGGGGGQISGPHADWHDAQNEYCVGQASGTNHNMYHDIDDDLWIAGPSGGSPPSGYLDQTDVFQYDTCP